MLGPPVLKTLIKSLNTIFQVLPFFLVPSPHFWKIYVKCPEEEFNADSIGIYLKFQKWKTKKLRIPFSIYPFLFWGNFNQIMFFPFFRIFFDVTRRPKATKLQRSNLVNETIDRFKKENLLSKKLSDGMKFVNLKFTGKKLF